MDRAEKQEFIDEAHQAFQAAEVVVVTHYQGLSVKESEALRGKVRDAGARFRVSKNRLTRLALRNTAFEGISDLMSGPTGIAWSEDPVSAAKAVVDYAKENDKLVILGGALGEKLLDEAAVKELAKMPSLDELRAKLVGLLQTPATQVAGVLQAPAGQLARVCGAYGASEG